MQDRLVGWSAGLYSAGIGASSAGDRPAELAAQVRFGVQDRPAGLAAQVTGLAVQDRMTAEASSHAARF